MEKLFIQRKYKREESFADAQKRATLFLKKLTNRKETFIVIVSHSVVLTILTSNLKKISMRRALKKVLELLIIKIKK